MPRVIEPYAEILTPFDSLEMRRKIALIELAARNCYKSEGGVEMESAEKLFRNCLSRNPPHQSFTEHGSFSVRFVSDRGFTHELVRHRIAAYTQESTRYCNYAKEKFGSQITVIKPCFWEVGTQHFDWWLEDMADAEWRYFRHLTNGAKPQEARTVLPQSTKADIIMTADVVEWMHVFRLRCHKGAHPQMRQLMIPVFRKFREVMPYFFGIRLPDDYKFKYTPGKVLEVDPYREHLKLLHGDETAIDAILGLEIFAAGAADSLGTPEGEIYREKLRQVASILAA